MKTIDLSTILAVVAAVGTLGGIFAWFLSRLLDDRLDAKESKMEIGFLKEKVKELKEEVDEIQDWRNGIRNN